MKYIALILVSLSLTGCGPAENKSRADKGSSGNRATRDVRGANPKEVDYPNYIRSHAFRTRKSNQLSHKSVQALVKSGQIPPWLHFIPNPDKDNEEQVIRALAPESDCGLSTMGNISARISDCKAKNPATYLWTGVDHGISGEGNWQLVGKKGTILMWLDLTTDLIWSSNLGNSDWVRASGARGFEAEAYCNSNNENPALGKIPADQIHWRLPTRADFLQADINGARFVLGDLDQRYWSASYSGKDRAWSVHQQTGILQQSDEEELLAVRCVGIIKK